MAISKPQGEMRSSSPFFLLFLCFVYLIIIFLCVGERVPGINESHYLPKAKHLWNAGFAPGDLFLESHDSHALASSMAGLAAHWLPLAAIAWLGRIISWCLLAWSWLILCRSLKLSPVPSVFALAGWLLAMHYGHWAGEWVVGGFEAKTIAYPLVLIGIAQVVRGNWHWAWVAMGGAMAWHPVVGGWGGLTAGIVWLLHGDVRRQLRQQLPWLAGGAALALVGVVPAASGLGGPDVIDKVSAAQVHVFMRLPHHLAPQLFASQRHWAAAITLAVFLALTLFVILSGKSKPAAKPPQDDSSWLGMRRLLLCGWIAVGFALIGWIIDAVLSIPRPDIAARLLRFYWFRWADVAVPLVSSLLLWKSLAQATRPSVAPNQHSSADASSHAKTTPRWIAHSILAIAIVGTVVALASRLRLGEERLVPAADRLVVDAVGDNFIATDRYVDWLAVCQWIRQQTPTDSLWLTPKYQQSFKWHAQRAEVVCWKDVPQDNASVIEWYHRIERCAPPRDRHGHITDWTTEQLVELSAEYGFRWVLIDRSYQSQPPALEIKYPLFENGQYIDNRSFAVMYIPDALLRAK